MVNACSVFGSLWWIKAPSHFIFHTLPSFSSFHFVLLHICLFSFSIFISFSDWTTSCLHRTSEVFTFIFIFHQLHCIWYLFSFFFLFFGFHFRNGERELKMKNAIQWYSNSEKPLRIHWLLYLSFLGGSAFRIGLFFACEYIFTIFYWLWILITVQYENWLPSSSDQVEDIHILFHLQSQSL